MNGCPSSTADGCRCPDHELGLMAHAKNVDAYAKALDRCRGTTRLSVVTFGPSVDPIPCTGLPTCPCDTCTAERRQLLVRGPQGYGNASPFKAA